LVLGLPLNLLIAHKKEKEKKRKEKVCIGVLIKNLSGWTVQFLFGQ
jgi:hypothetical protein